MSPTKSTILRPCRVLWAVLVALTAIPAGAQEARTNRIQIEYVPPKSANFQSLFDRLKAGRALEKMQEIFSPFRLPNDLNLRTFECGMANAWYQRPTVTICYEYLYDIRNTMPKETTTSGVTATDAILGQFFYVVAHEMGHAMFDFLNVPLWGRAEDAADQFATYIMLLFGKQDARRLIGGAAFSYKNYVQNPKITVRLEAFSEVHGAPMQRFYNLLCMAYGADRETFGDLVEKGFLPQARAKNCRVEFGEVNFAFQQTNSSSCRPGDGKDALADEMAARRARSPRYPTSGACGRAMSACWVASEVSDRVAADFGRSYLVLMQPAGASVGCDIVLKDNTHEAVAVLELRLREWRVQGHATRHHDSATRARGAKGCCDRRRRCSLADRPRAIIERAWLCHQELCFGRSVLGHQFGGQN